MSPQKRYSNFTSTTILAQNTDGWQSNWASSYQNILSGTPAKMRVGGTAPSIKRSFNTIQANDEHTLTYTQTGSNSINLLVEQSPNGSTWNAIYNAATSNGNNTHSFTPTQSYLRVSYEANAAFEIGDVVLSGMHVDTVVNVIAGGYASYRYGFNGMEKDDEVKGRGNSYTTEFRQYDPRIGRWLSIDPRNRKYPDISPYVSYANNPILFTDIDGDTIRLSGTKAEQWKAVGFLQTLTNDKLTLKNGMVMIEKVGGSNHNKDLPSGTGLISELISEKHTLTIFQNKERIKEVDSQAGEDRNNMSNGIGTNQTMNIDLTHLTKLLTNDPKTKKKQIDS